MNYITDDFKSKGNGFCFSYEKELEPGETRLLKMPRVSANKRGVNDIGFAAEHGITIYATLSEKPQNDEVTLWQEINPFDEINKTAAYIKIVNSGEQPARINVRAILC